MNQDYYIDKAGNDIVIYGEGGKGGGDAHTPVEASDTLYSKQTIKLLFVLSEGELSSTGSVMPDVYLNQIPFYKNGAYTTNFIGTIDFRAGTLDQTVISGFTSTESSITTNFPNMLQGIGHSVNVAGNFNSARITLTLESLRHIAENGDINGNTVEHSVEVQSHSVLGGYSGWTNVGNITKTGKASSPYSWDTLVKRPTSTYTITDWNIRITRTTVDDPTVKFMSKCSWLSTIAIEDVAHTYPNSSLVAITLTDASQFGGSIPEIMFKPRGIKVPVLALSGSDIVSPINYAYSANPAYCLLYVLITPKGNGGLGIPKSDIDLIAIYNLAQYCDVGIAHTIDGVSVSLPRYEIHNQFYTRENVPTFLMYLLNICNANFTTNEFGQISVMYDHAGQVVTKQVTNANIIGGKFSYSSNDLESRCSLVNVTYNNSNYFGRTDTVTVEESALTTRYGLQTLDVVLPGCIDEAQATRKARTVIYTNARLTGMVNFSVLFQGLSYHVGELVRVYDNDNTQQMQAGMVVSSSQSAGTTTIVIDRLLTFPIETSTFYGIDSSGNITGTISSHSTVSPYTVTVSNLITPLIGSVFNILSNIQTGKVVKVIKIDKSGAEYIISCVDHSEDKYTYVDGNIALVLPSGDLANNLEYGASPVSSITIVPNFSSDGVVSKSKFQISWVEPSTSYKQTYRLSWRRDNDNIVYIKDIAIPYYEIIEPVPGNYTVTVWSVNSISSVSSTPVIFNYAYRVAVSNSTLKPPKDIYVLGTTGYTFDTPDLTIGFKYDTVNDTIAVTDALKDYVVEVWGKETIPLLKTTFIVPVGKSIWVDGVFTFTLHDNIMAFGAATRQFDLKFFSRDILGDVSLPAVITISNPLPAISEFTFSLVDGISNVYVNIKPTVTASRDITGYRIWQCLTADVGSFVKSDTNWIYSGIDTYVSLPAAGSSSYTYWVAAYDSFGKTGLNYSTSQAGIPLSVDAATWSIASGLTFTAVSTTHVLSWTAGTILKGGETVTRAITAGSTTWSSGFIYIYYDTSVSSTVLQATPTLATAVGIGCYPIATYTGGDNTTIKGGSGDAFISGSQLIAGTVGASQIIAGSITASLIDTTDAVITGEAQISTGVITDVLTSSSYNNTTKVGWKLDKTGNMTTYGAIKIGTQNAATGTAVLTFVASPYTLLGIAVKNNSIVSKNTATTAWDTYAYSSEKFTSPCAVKFSVSATTKACAIGLKSDVSPTASASFTTINHCFVFSATGTFTLYEDNVLFSPSITGVYTVEDSFEIKFSGTVVTYYKNGVLIATSSAVLGTSFYFATSFYDNGASIDRIQFGQYISLVPDYGARMEITGDTIKVYDSGNVIRVQLGNLS